MRVTVASCLDFTFNILLLRSWSQSSIVRHVMQRLLTSVLDVLYLLVGPLMFRGVWDVATELGVPV
jgi:hypothetical protein